MASFSVDMSVAALALELLLVLGAVVAPLSFFLAGRAALGFDFDVEDFDRDVAGVVSSTLVDSVLDVDSINLSLPDKTYILLLSYHLLNFYGLP